MSDGAHAAMSRWRPGGSSDGLLGLLRRPLALAWVPLSALTSITVMALFLFADLATNGARFALPRGAIFAVVSPTLAALIGLLVGQAIKELQHCHFAWGLPRRRERLRPTALGIGFLVAMFGREIVVVVAWLASIVMFPLTREMTDPFGLWMSFPPLSVGLVALSLLAYWIGVRPSSINLPLALLPVVALSPLLAVIAEGWSVLAAALSTPLTAFLVHDTFSIAAARRRPFVPTQPLTGGAWSRGRPRPLSSPTTRILGGARWRVDCLGQRIPAWMHAGWYENHGWAARGSLPLAILTAAASLALIISMAIKTIRAAPSLWFDDGHGGYGVPNFVRGSTDTIIIGSMIVGVPILVACLCYASISLRPGGPYPLSRRRRATVEYWSGLAEAAVGCALLAGILLGFWKVMMLFDSGLSTPWPTHLGGEYGWVLALARAIATLFLLAPIVQMFRLRYLRSRSPRSSVVRLLLVLLLTSLLAWIGVWMSLVPFYVLARYPLVVHGLIFATAAMIAQYAYRRAIDRYFRTADLV